MIDRISLVLHVFDLPAVKLVGAFFLWGLLCFAAGNSHKTEAALTGQAKYFQQHERKTAAVVADVVAKKVRHEDAHVIGVSPEVLKGAVDAAKVVDKK